MNLQVSTSEAVQCVLLGNPFTSIRDVGCQKVWERSLNDLGAVNKLGITMNPLDAQTHLELKV